MKLDISFEEIKQIYKEMGCASDFDETRLKSIKAVIEAGPTFVMSTPFCSSNTSICANFCRENKWCKVTETPIRFYSTPDDCPFLR